MSSDFDIGPLTWVKPEIDIAIGSIQVSLDLFKSHGDAGQLRFCMTHLHQISGALDMVGLEGATHFCHEMEKLADLLAKQSIVNPIQATTAVTEGIAALSKYLDDLINGADDVPLRLYPALQAITFAQGREQLSESELFFPDLNLRAPSGLPVDEISESELPKHINKLRSQYQRGLLKWLTTLNPDGLEAMRDTLEAVQHSQKLPLHKTIWWSAAAMLDGLAHNALPAQPAIKRLCRRLDQQLRSLQQGTTRVAGTLLRDTLYYVAKSEPLTESLKRAKDNFELEGLIPPEFTAGSSSNLNEADGLQRLSALLPELKDLWTQAAAGIQQAFDDFAERMRTLEVIENQLNNPAVVGLCECIQAATKSLVDEKVLPQEGFSMDMAAALSLLEEAVENYARYGNEHPAYASDMLQRLALGASANPASLQETPLDKTILAAVGQEIKQGLHQIEQSLDAYFRDPSLREVLTTLSAPLHQVAGAFNILELPTAANVAESARGFVKWFEQADAALAKPYFELVAESLSALGFYVDEVLHGNNEAEQRLAPIASALQIALTQLESLPAVATAPVKPVAPVRRGRKKKVSDSSADAELLDIYLTEADEVLEAIATCVQNLRVDASDKQVLTDMRRGFHTLKGSGRTVGLMALGDVAWSIEQLLNALLDAKLLPQGAQLDFVERVQAAFYGWITDLRKKGSATLDPVEWQTEAASLMPVNEVAIYNPVATLDVPSAPIVSDELQSVPSMVPAVVRKEVVIGGVHTIPKELFEIFLNEARQCLRVLADGFQLLKQESEIAPISDMLRASHTLAGISKTANISLLSDLTKAFEYWFEKQSDWQSQQFDLFADVLRVADVMLSRIALLRMPKSAQYLVNALNASDDIALVAVADAATDDQTLSLSEQFSNELASRAQSQMEEPEVFDSASFAANRESSADRQLLDLFMEEARELHPMIGQELRNWRSNPAELDASRNMQRALHTLKGSARMAGQMTLGDRIHNLEGLVIDALKKSPSIEHFEGMLTEFDDIGMMLDEIDSGGTSIATTDVVFDVSELAKVRATQHLRIPAETLDQLINVAGEISISRSRIERETLTFKSSILDLTESVFRLRAYLRELEIEAESQLQSRLTHLQESQEEFDPLEMDRFTRLQELTRMMAESVNDVATTQHGLMMNLDESESALKQQNRMNRDMQYGLTRVRMIPFASMADRLYRIVRQTARELDKQVELSIDGGNVEMDRSVLEKIGGTLEHLLRNAVGHGIEDATTRAKSGKNVQGSIHLSVRQENNEITLVVKDDGAGINLQQVKKRAQETGLIEEGGTTSEQSLLSAIFEPGLSTSSEITQVSGRGVGLDAVRAEITALGGRIDVTSIEGAGATFTVYLPVTLSVAQLVLVRAGESIYALPSVMVEQVQKLKSGALGEGYEKESLIWGQKSYPMYYLPRLLGDNEQPAEAQRYTPVLFLRSGNYHVALHVDEIIGNRESVMKNIGPQLARVPGIIGATVLGDGDIILIINPVQLANREQLVAGSVRTNVVSRVELDTANTIMVVDDSLTMRKVTSRLLIREGYQVVTAKDGMDALQQLQDVIPDVILLDIEMPRMDGFELARNIRDDGRTKHIPLIVISSRTAEKHRAVAKEIGIDAYLGKPFQDEELLANIETFIKAKKQLAA